MTEDDVAFGYRKFPFGQQDIEQERKHVTFMNCWLITIKILLKPCRFNNLITVKSRAISIGNHLRPSTIKD